MAKKKRKKLKFGKIKIIFRNGSVDVIPKKLYDSYTYTGCLFVIKRRGAWITVYNIGDISVISVDNKIVKK